MVAARSLWLLVPLRVPILSEACSLSGKDATEEFEAVGHSVSSRRMMPKYFIGNLEVLGFPFFCIWTAGPSVPGRSPRPLCACPPIRGRTLNHGRNCSGKGPPTLQRLAPAPPP